jgi:SAM-dependent methyltransferase
MTVPQDRGFEQAWRRRFERFARASDNDAGIAGWSDRGLAARVRRFVQLWERQRQRDVAAAPSGRWLDAGSGAGTYTRLLDGWQLDTVAVDYSEPTVQKARPRCAPRLQWAVADVTQLPFADASFDGVLCFGVMQALATPGRAVRELRRVLRPGGTLWVDALNAECLPTRLAERRRIARGEPAHLRYDVPSQFVAAVRASGFGEVQAHWVPIAPAALRWAQPVLESAAFDALARLVAPLGAAASHSFLVRAEAAA